MAPINVLERPTFIGASGGAISSTFIGSSVLYVSSTSEGVRPARRAAVDHHLREPAGAGLHAAPAPRVEQAGPQVPGHHSHGLVQGGDPGHPISNRAGVGVAVPSGVRECHPVGSRALPISAPPATIAIPKVVNIFLVEIKADRGIPR